MAVNIVDNIYFTRLARIEASKRLLQAERQYQILLIAYSLMGVSLSIIFLVYKSTPFDNVIMCLLSTIVLVLSLFISNSNYKGRGLEMKDNYINLQRLYLDATKIYSENDSMGIERVQKEYINLLHQTENHTYIDDIKSRKNRNTTRNPSSEEINTLSFDGNLKLLGLIISWTPFTAGLLYGTKTLFGI